MPTREATVLFKGEPAGALVETARGGTRFTYRDGWRTPIACQFPCDEREYVWEAGLHPFFQHLGPEGWLREMQAREGRVDQEDDFGLLLRYGRDCIGAVGVVPLVDTSGNVANVIVGDVEAEAAAGGRRTVSGVQRKLLVHREQDQYRPSGPDSPATHIAKLNPQSNDTLVRNEFLSLSLARELLGETEITRFERKRIPDLDEVALVVERFDRNPAGQKLRLEDFAQIIAKPRGVDFKGKYDSSYEEIAAAIRSFSARPAIDIEKFFRRVVVCFIIGNADAHLKNFSLLERPEGLRLSPSYDMLNTLIYGAHYDTYAALALNGRNPSLDALTRGEVETFGAGIGLNLKAIRGALDHLHKRLRKARILDRPPLPPPSEFDERYADIVRNAASRILES